jgi:hypothetical protein
MSLAKNKLRVLLDKLTESEIFAIMLVVEELQQSKKKHPTFADGSLTLAASIVSEECGEMCQQVNQYVQEEGSTISNMIVEGSHTAVTAIRFIEMVDKMSEQVNTPDLMNDYKEALRVIDNMLREELDDFDILTKMKLLFNLEKRK